MKTLKQMMCKHEDFSVKGDLQFSTGTCKKDELGNILEKLDIKCNDCKCNLWYEKVHFSFKKHEDGIHENKWGTKFIVDSLNFTDPVYTK